MVACVVWPWEKKQRELMGWRKIWALSRHATLGSVCRNIKYARNNPIHTTVYIHHKQATASHKNTQTQSTHALLHSTAHTHATHTTKYGNTVQTQNTHRKLHFFNSHSDFNMWSMNAYNEQVIYIHAQNMHTLAHTVQIAQNVHTNTTAHSLGCT